MGLFDDEIVQVQTVSAKLSKEKSNPVRDAVVFASMANRSIADNILAVQITGYHIKARKYLKYGNEKYELGPGVVTFRKRYFKFGIPPDDIPITMEMYPTTLIRRDGVFVDNNKQDNIYVTGKKLAKRGGLKLSDLISTIAEGNVGSGVPGQPPEENPDLAKVNDAFFTFSLDIYSKLEVSAEYLYSFWDYISTLPQQTKEEFDQEMLGLGDDTKGPPSMSLLFTHGDFNADISWDYMVIEDKSGTLTDPDGKDLEFQTDIDFQDPKRYFFDGGGGGGPNILATRFYDVEVTSFRVRKQTAPGVIREIQIHGLFHNTSITPFGGDTVVKTIIALDKIPWGYTEDDDEHGRSGFFIPLSPEYIRPFSSLKEQLILQDGMQLVIFAADKQELAWYETAIFKVLITIIGIILIAYSLGTAAGVTEVLWKIFETIVLTFILPIVLELISEKFGTTAAIFAAAAAIAAGTKTGKINLGSLANTKELMQLTKVFQITLKADLAAKAGTLEDDIKSWTQTAEERIKEIKEANDYLYSGSGYFDPLLITAASSEYFQSESPTDFYERTIHTGNPGVLSLDQISTYYDDILRLPKATLENETIY